MKSVCVLAFVLALSSPGFAFAMKLTSPDIQDGASIAREQVYTRCGGENVSPALAWSGVPANTKSLALSVIDPDARPAGWTHWLIVDFPASTSSLDKGAALPPGARAMKNDFGEAKYDGPCPPKGSGVHHYHFTLWALRASPALAEGAKPKAITAALEKQAIAKATLTGTYEIR